MAALPALLRRPSRQRITSPNTLVGAGAWRGPRSNGKGNDGAITAAGFRIQHQDTDTLRRLIMPWQTRAFNYYDLVPEIKYSGQFYARMLAPLRLYAAHKNDEGEWEEIEDQNDPAVVALDRIQDPGGGRESLLASYGRLIFLVGESLLFVTLGEDGEEQWEMLSTDELRIQAGVYLRYKAPSLMAEEFREPTEDDWEPVDDDHAIAYRLWRRHPRYSMWPDSTMQGVLDLCEELVLLTQAVRARARSRLAGSGILFIDERVSASPPEAAPDEDVTEDRWMNAVTAAMMAPLKDEGTPSSIMPILSRVTVPEGMKLSDLVYHLKIIDPVALYPETGLRRECIERIAIGLDMPPEQLLGMSEANHWTAWQIDEQTWKAHGAPVGNQLVNDLTQAYFRPQLREDGIQNPEDYKILYDASAVINHPDRGKDALNLYDREALSKEALREASGFDEADEMPDDERAERIGIKVRDSSLAWYGIPSLRSPTLEPESGVLDTGAPGQTEGKPAPSGGSEVEKGPPPGEGVTPAEAEGVEPSGQTASAATNGNGNGYRVQRIVAVADLATLRSREAAGARLVSLVRGDAELRALVRDVPLYDVARILGPDRVAALNVTEADLIDAGPRIAKDQLRLWGVHGERADLIVEQIRRHAARNLYEPVPGPLPPNFEAYVDGLMKVKA